MKKKCLAGFGTGASRHCHRGPGAQPLAVTIQLPVRVPPHPTPRRGNHSSTLWDGSLNGDAFRAWRTALPLPWGEGRVRGNGLTGCIVAALGCRSMVPAQDLGKGLRPLNLSRVCSLKAALPRGSSVPQVPGGSVKMRRPAGEDRAGVRRVLSACNSWPRHAFTVGGRQRP